MIIPTTNNRSDKENPNRKNQLIFINDMKFKLIVVNKQTIIKIVNDMTSITASKKAIAPNL